MLNPNEYDIVDIQLAEEGKHILQQAAERMPVLGIISDRFSIQRPFEGYKIVVCSHVTKETGVACIGIKEGGADLLVVAANHLSTNDAVAASLVKHHDIPVFGHHLMSDTEALEARKRILDFEPDIILDDAAEALPLVYKYKKEMAKKLLGTTEQTTAGVAKVKVLDQNNMLEHPVIAINSSKIKSLFDNVYGVGQSTIHSILEVTGMLIAGHTVVVLGYGHVGRGVASRFKGMGARVIICEIDPLKALDAHLKGYQVLPLCEAAEIGDIFVTVTGSKGIIMTENILKMKSGAFLANCGSGKYEIDVQGLKEHIVKEEEINPLMKRCTLDNGRWVNLLANGRVLNLVACGGNSSEIMDFTFSAILLGAEYLVQHQGELSNSVHVMPEKIDQNIAYIKLNEYCLKIDTPTPLQEQYEQEWVKD